MIEDTRQLFTEEMTGTFSFLKQMLDMVLCCCRIFMVKTAIDWPLLYTFAPLKIRSCASLFILNTIQLNYV
jgi:hypothetical protein